LWAGCLPATHDDIGVLAGMTLAEFADQGASLDFPESDG
jgi:hypothetical protein